MPCHETRLCFPCTANSCTAHLQSLGASRAPCIPPPSPLLSSLLPAVPFRTAVCPRSRSLTSPTCCSWRACERLSEGVNGGVDESGREGGVRERGRVGARQLVVAATAARLMLLPPAELKSRSSRPSSPFTPPPLPCSLPSNPPPIGQEKRRPSRHHFVQFSP